MFITNNITLLFIFYITSIIYIAIDIFLVVRKDLIDKDLLFCMFSTYIFNLSLNLFYFYFNNLTYSLLNSLFLMVTSFLLILDLKRVLKKTPLLSLPYFLFTIVIFSYIVNQFLILAH